MDGIVNIYKEKGFTSHDVVAKMRGILKQKKIGHTGTLDPEAVGVLPVCLGKATKLCSLLTDWDKQYEAVLRLGMTTDTEDMTGQILTEAACNVTKEQVKEAIESFVGTYEQVPPMYSAKKINGKKLYELAREGKVVERKPTSVTITSIEIKEISLPEVTFVVTCSKGTYIRSLCRDIGQKLGCGGCMAALTRTRTGNFTIEAAIPLKKLEQLRDDGELTNYITPIEQVLSMYEKAQVYKPFEKLLYNGNPLLQSQFQLAGQQTQKIRMYDTKGNFIGLYCYVEQKGQWKPEKMFLS